MNKLTLENMERRMNEFEAVRNMPYWSRASKGCNPISTDIPIEHATG